MRAWSPVPPLTLASILAATLLACGHGSSSAPAPLPPEGGIFTRTVVVSGLVNPTAMALVPDGRILICEQGGSLRVAKGGALLATPLLTLPVDASGERGLLGVTVDPAFAANGFVYVYYTATTPAPHNRISRFTTAGDLVVPGSEAVLLDLDGLGAATNHNGGALHFGPDGKLYAGVGENANAANAQSLTNLLGKVLRLDSDGGVPAGNPLLAQTLSLIHISEPTRPY